MLFNHQNARQVCVAALRFVQLIVRSMLQVFFNRRKELGTAGAYSGGRTHGPVGRAISARLSGA